MCTNFYSFIKTVSPLGERGHEFHNSYPPSPIDARHQIWFSSFRQEAENVLILTHDDGRKHIEINNPSDIGDLIITETYSKI